MDRKLRQLRSAPGSFETREDAGELYIEGYFSVFGDIYNLWPGATETILPGAFSETLSGDIRALIDHDTRLVLGRTKSGTLELRGDSRGLWGRVRVNREDVDAMNLYARIQRGDVDQCSFGFEIDQERYVENPDNSVRWEVEKVTLYEVSVVTFPAYEETSVSARKQEFAELQKRKTQAWREAMQRRLKGDRTDGVKGADAPSEAGGQAK